MITAQALAQRLRAAFRSGDPALPADERAEHQRLADEQAALRRVADLAAGGASLAAVLALVASEARQLFSATFTGLCRVDADGDLTIVALDNAPAELVVGHREQASAHGLLQESLRLGRPIRLVGLEGLPADWAACAHRLQITSGLAAPILVDGRIWGGLAAMSAGPAARGAQYRLGRFAELAGSAIGGAHARDELRAIAAEQAALRRVAERAAGGASQDEVFATVVDETAELFGVDAVLLLSEAPDGSYVIAAERGLPAGFAVGHRGAEGGDGVVQRVRRTGRPARVDTYEGLTGPAPAIARRHGFAAGAGAPVIIEGRMWGVLTAFTLEAAPAAGIEQHLAQFADLVATALAGAQARADLQELADEQAALRRVAELVARGVGQDELLASVAVEASRLIDDEPASLLRFDDDGGCTIVASCGGPAPVGTRTMIAPDDEGIVAQIRRTGRPARLDDYSIVGGRAWARDDFGVAACVGVPIFVEDRLWGVLGITRAERGTPIAAEQRLQQFAELIAAAIANAENRAQLTASRARVISTADETRRRVQRDVHDGAQQRLVQTIINLKLATAALAGDDTDAAARYLADSLQHAEQATADLRDLVRGILPAALSRGGLRAGVESLVSDVRLPVAVEISAPRLPSDTETTAYFVIAEALTNVVKHAGAGRARVVARMDGDRLAITVADDGAGGADAARGSGLTGLLDRVEAGDGTLSITSPPGRGTTVHAELPVAGLSVVGA